MIKVGTVLKSLTGKKDYIITVTNIIFLEVSGDNRILGVDQKGKHHSYWEKNIFKKFEIIG